ncbi:MAG: histidine phosphatase family protein [Thermodesulfobacteriota bacterium]
MVKRLLLARHCETGPDYSGRFVGSSDIGLGPTAPEQAERLAAIIGAYQPAITFCSPLRRAQLTAGMVGNDTLLGEILTEPDLREVDFGRWEGLTFAEIAKSDSELVKRWSVWSPEFAFPDGEVTADFLKRVQAVGDRLAAREEETVLVIAHGGVVRALICHLLGLPASNYLLFDIKPARLTVIDYFSEGGVLSGLNL